MGLAYNESGSLRAGMGSPSATTTKTAESTCSSPTSMKKEALSIATRPRPLRGRDLPGPPDGAEPLEARVRGRILDFDNDGGLDLFVANGHVNDVRPMASPTR